MPLLEQNRSARTVDHDQAMDLHRAADRCQPPKTLNLQPASCRAQLAAKDQLPARRSQLPHDHAHLGSMLHLVGNSAASALQQVEIRRTAGLTAAAAVTHSVATECTCSLRTGFEFGWRSNMQSCGWSQQDLGRISPGRSRRIRNSAPVAHILRWHFVPPRLVA